MVRAIVLTTLVRFPLTPLVRSRRFRRCDRGDADWCDRLPTARTVAPLAPTALVRSHLRHSAIPRQLDRTETASPMRTGGATSMTCVAMPTLSAISGETLP